MASPATWQKVKTDAGEYWWNTTTDETSWTDPALLPAAPTAGGGSLLTQQQRSPPPAPSTAMQAQAGSGGKTSPPSSPGQPVSGRPSTVSTLMRDNSSRIRRLFNKTAGDEGGPGGNNNNNGGEVVAEVSAAPKPRKNTPPPPVGGGSSPAGALSAAAASDKAAQSWQARRKQSFAAVFGQGNALPEGSIEAHVQNMARETKKDVAEVVQNLTISKPFEFEHKVKVRFDEDNIRFSGLPEDWSKEAHKQFGIPLHACPRVEVPGFADRIPLVLVKLKQRFGELNGYTAEGVFRIAPDGEDVSWVRNALNGGKALESLQTTQDPHVVANLVKQFFRELKPKILFHWTKDQVMELASVTGDDVSRAGDLVRILPEPQQSTFLWLLDFLADVAAQSAVNKMTWTNLAIVLSPNLYDAVDATPMEELIISQKLAQCICVCLKWRIQSRMGS